MIFNQYEGFENDVWALAFFVRNADWATHVTPGWEITDAAAALMDALEPAAIGDK